MEAVEEVPDAPLDADDLARGALPSDDEEGPDEPDEDEDAMPPGGLHMEEADDDDTAMEIETDTGAATGATAAAPSGPPELPTAIETLKVDDLKEQLIWRGIKSSLKQA